MSVQAHAYLHEVPDLEEFERFWRRVHGRLYRFVLRALDRADADEIVQETMIRCYENWARLDPQRDPWPWLTVVARNISADHVRARARREAHESAVVADEVVGGSLDEHVCAHELTRDVQRALLALPENDRRVLAMHHYDGLSTAEIAELTGRTDNAVRQQLFRARRRLAESWQRVLTGAGAAIAPLRSWLRRSALRTQDVSGAASTSVAVCLSIAATVSIGLGSAGIFGSRTDANASGPRAAATVVAPAAASDRVRGLVRAAGSGSATAGRVATAPPGGSGPGRPDGRTRTTDPTGTVVVTTSGDPVGKANEPTEWRLEVFLPGDPNPVYFHHYMTETPADDVICALPVGECA